MNQPGLALLLASVTIRQRNSIFTDVLMFGILSRVNNSCVQPVAVVSDQTGNVELLLGVPDGVDVAFSVIFEL